MFGTSSAIYASWSTTNCWGPCGWQVGLFRVPRQFEGSQDHDFENPEYCLFSKRIVLNSRKIAFLRARTLRLPFASHNSHLLRIQSRESFFAVPPDSCSSRWQPQPRRRLNQEWCSSWFESEPKPICERGAHVLTHCHTRTHVIAHELEYSALQHAVTDLTIIIT